MLPLGNRVFLRRIDSAQTAPSPFITPDVTKEKATLCEVVAVPSQPYLNEWNTTIYCPVSVGDQVIIGKYTIDTKINGEDLVVVRWDELLAWEPAAVPVAAAPVPFDLKTVQERTIEVTDRHLATAVVGPATVAIEYDSSF